MRETAVLALSDAETAGPVGSARIGGSGALARLHGSSTTGGSATGIMFGALRLAASCAALDVMQRWSGVELFQFAAAAY